MGNDLESIIKIIGAILLTLGFLGSAFVFLKGSAYKGTIEALTGTVDALQKRVDLQDKEITSLGVKRDADRLQMEKLQIENNILLSQRPSNVILESIVNMIDNNHKQLIQLVATLNDKKELA